MTTMPVTRRTPACPPWCTATRQEHDAEAREPSASWFSHTSAKAAAAHPVDRGPVTVHLSQLQIFDEQAQPDVETDKAVIVAGLILEPTEARRLAEALTRAADLVEGVEQ